MNNTNSVLVSNIPSNVGKENVSFRYLPHD